MGDFVGREHIIGKSDVMQNLFDQLEQIFRHDVPVLIEGESGTGKELFARAIHYNGSRKDKEFVVINCSALPDNLLESELFGHLKGAFTGAIKEKQGLFEVADNGTFFLDEIADMSPALQVKLLRVLQEGTFLKIGGVNPVKVNLRIVCASNKNLEALVKEGKFREDLFYRINVVHMTLPPLRARKDDIEELISYFLKQIVIKNALSELSISDEALHLLANYEWPGNIRQLENEIEKSSIFAKNHCIEKDNLSHAITGYIPNPEMGSGDIFYSVGIDSLGEIKRRYSEAIEIKVIKEGLEKTQWNKTACAQLLKISRGDLMRKLAKYEIKKP
ncbi:sigma-54 interaction domain-containing protein [Candidatus Omnitrophota bacterium]